MGIRTVEIYTEQMAKLNEGGSVEIELNSELTIRLIAKKVTAPKRLNKVELGAMLRSKGYKGPVPTAHATRSLSVPVTSQAGLPNRMALESALAEEPDPLLGLTPESYEPDPAEGAAQDKP